MKHQLWVRWICKDPATIERIRNRFGMRYYQTLNGLTPCLIDDDDMALLKETARRGFISIIRAKWQENGDSFAFISR